MDKTKLLQNENDQLDLLRRIHAQSSGWQQEQAAAKLARCEARIARMLTEA